MIIRNRKIVEATENELFCVYLQKEYDDIMPFDEYLRRCEINGTKIIGRERELQ